MPEIKTELFRMLSETISPVAVRIWLDDCGFIGLRAGGIELEIPSDFKRKMLEKRFGEVIENALTELTGMYYPVRFVLKASGDGNAECFSLEDFVKGKGNELALAAVLAATDRPCERLSHPVYIYGAEKLGKTHLLRGAEKRISELSPETGALYIQTEEFLELFGAPKKDFILIDDFIPDETGKLQTYLKSALSCGTNIIAAGRIPPSEAPDGGSFLLPGTDIVCSPADIQPPDVETLQAINMSVELRRGNIVSLP